MLSSVKRFDRFLLVKDSRHQITNLCKRLQSSENSITVSEKQIELRSKFEAAKIPDPESSASILIGHVIGCDNVEKLESVYKNRRLGTTELSALSVFEQCRLARMPVQYIVKTWQFRDLRIFTRPPVFIPRPETEAIVDIVLENLPKRSESAKILEIGCGSGVISISLAKESGLKVTAVDQSANACALTLENARENGVEDLVEVVAAKIEENGKFEPQLETKGAFDLIVSNPPYVTTKDLMAVEPEIKLFEDLRALNGGKDGTEVIIPILKFAKDNLKPNGLVIMEVDPCHPLLLPRRLSQNPDLEVAISIESVRKDIFGKERFIVFRRK